MSASADKYLYRQLLVLCATCMLSFGFGIMLAFPSVLNPAILSPNSTDIKATPDQVSWIAASHGLSGLVGFAILSPIFQTMGRKKVNLTMAAIVLIGWLIFWFSDSVAALIMARVVQGLAIGGVYIIAVNLSESSHPQRRGYFMAMKKVSMAFGALVCHSLGLVWNWRQISMFTVMVLCVTGVLLICCPESPSYLAMVGQFADCKKSFRWLFGTSPDREKELQELISSQMKITEEKTSTKSNLLVETAKVLMRKDFQRPFFIVVLSTLAVDACGRYFMFAYITQIMIEVTGDKSISIYCSIAGDCLLIIALSLSCLVVKSFKRRHVIFGLGFLSAFLMFLVSVTVILKSHSVVSYMRWLTPSVILLHSFTAHIGLVPVTFAIVSEIFPLAYKGLASFTTGIVFTIFYTLTLKLTPAMISKTGIDGTYAIYGSCVLICLVILYFILPETKDRTLQDIENEIRGAKKRDVDVETVLIKDTNI